MEILRIETTFNKERFIRIQIIRWKIHWLKNKRHIINYSIISLVLILLSILTRTKEEPLNPFSFLTIAFVFMTLLLIFVRIFSKRKFAKKIKEIADRFETLKMDCVYEFSEKSIRYWDNEKSMEFKWSVFLNYSIYKNYIILLLNNTPFDTFIFEKKDSKIDEYSKILEIVSSKLIFKEMK